MGKLKFHSMKLKKLNKPSIFPFNISSHRHDMIILEHLSDRTKSRLCRLILFYFVYFGSLKNYLRTRVSDILDIKYGAIERLFTSEEVNRRSLI